MAENVPTTDTNRGIQNTQARFADHTRDRLTSEQLLTKARRSKRNPESIEEFSEIDTQYTTTPQYRKSQSLKQQKEAIRGNIIKKARTLGTFSKWMGLGVVGTSYLWQLVFGLISLLIFVLHGEILNFQNNTVLGKVTSWFFDFGKIFSTEQIGLVVWGIAVLIVLITFLGFYLWYRLLGIKPFGTVISAFVTILALSLSLLPVTNLFPWLVLWVLYMNASSLFSNK